MRSHKNSRHMKATPIIVKQYLRDQLTKSTGNPLDDILEHFEKLAHKNVRINHDRQCRENTYMNNSKDTQHSNIKEHTVNQVPVNCKQEENQKHIPVH